MSVQIANRNKLLIEDFDINRELGKELLVEKGYNMDLFFLPKNRKDCETILSENVFHSALIDFDLSEWTGKEGEPTSPIVFGNKKCKDGVELAEYLLNVNPLIRIGLFSSNEDALEKTLKKSHIKEMVELISQENVDPQNINSFINDFFESEKEENNKVKQFVNIDETIIKIAIKPLHVLSKKMEEKVEIFLAKRILGLLDEENGEYFWKLGKYFWLIDLVKINPRISNEQANGYPNISVIPEEINEMGNDYTSENQIEEFEIILNGDYKIKRFINAKSGNIIDLEVIDKLIELEEIQINSTVDQYIISKIICQKYLKGENFDISKTEKTLKKLNKYIRLESIKYLFKVYCEKSQKDFKINSKEDVYERLIEFYQRSFHNILDIYTGRVDYIDDEKGIVKFESVSPEKVVRKEEIDINLLLENYLEENSYFEFTIHETDIGGVASHIQPI